MSRPENKMVMGYFPIEERHHAAILSLVAPTSDEVKLLDPCAGEGEFLAAAAQAWGCTPYANELDAARAERCIARFGPRQAVQGDMERLNASSAAFGILWVNPPYDHDASASAGNKRVELRFLRHAWKWAQLGAVVFWVVYDQHITEDASAFLAKHSQQVDIWALPGKHLGEYDQRIVVAIKGEPRDQQALYDHIRQAKASPKPLTVQAEPVYRAPAPPRLRRFIFTPNTINEQQGLRLIEEGGAWKTNGFQALLAVPAQIDQSESVVAPRPGHIALVLAAGVANGSIIHSPQYGRVALRGTTRHVEQIARVEAEADPRDPAQTITKTTLRSKPATTLTLLSETGERIEMQGDAALLDFIRRHKPALAEMLNRHYQPLYAFDFNGLGRWLSRLKLNGKYGLYTAQRHVVGALTRGLEVKHRLLLVGQMGVGKTAIGSATALAIASGQTAIKVKAGQVVLIVCPPHLIDKWRREILSLDKSALVAQVDNARQLTDFMEQASATKPNTPKIMLIKRDMTKLGCRRNPAVVWRKHHVAQWPYGALPPYGIQPQQRIKTVRVPHCPNCHSPVYRQVKGQPQLATLEWLKAGARSCKHCGSPLWQEARDKPLQANDKPSPTRYRLDMLIKRRCAGRIALLIWDEAHEAAHGDTGNGESFGRLAGVTNRVLALTGTPFNGRASSLFNLEYHLNPRIRERYPWGGAPRQPKRQRGSRTWPEPEEASSQRGQAEARWVEDMGVREKVVEEVPQYDPRSGVYTGTKTYQRPYEEAPGISPLLVAEMLDHAIFFSLSDLGKRLPKFSEIAVPVSLDDDVQALYDETRHKLKDYMTQRRWEGDTSFRGAYLQWAMGWLNQPYRDYEVVHNLKHPLTGEKQAQLVVKLEALEENRLYAKERALIDLLNDQLSAGQKCVVYVRQTQTRDIQPRLEALIKEHVVGAKPYILRNTVQAQRRERTIEEAVKQGANVIIANPELVKTGLDLVFAQTLIFYEITFNLSTMMQAAARSYRLNQTAESCQVYYLFAEGTMEHSAVQLMSRKQRAAKLLNGEVGLTGLDALTEGESGLEEALLKAIGREEALVNPSELFKQDADHIDQEDAAYWRDAVAEEETQEAPALAPQAEAKTEQPSLFQYQAQPTQAALAQPDPIEAPTAKLQPQQAESPTPPQDADDGPPEPESLGAYLDSVCLIFDARKRAELEAELLKMLHQQPSATALAAWIRISVYAHPTCADQVAEKLLSLPLPPAETKPPTEAKPKAAQRAKAVPDELLTIVSKSQKGRTDGPQQLALF